MFTYWKKDLDCEWILCFQILKNGMLAFIYPMHHNNWFGGIIIINIRANIIYGKSILYGTHSSLTTQSNLVYEWLNRYF